jgi:cell division protein FtsN
MNMHKQRGQGNTGVIFVLLAVAIVLIIAAISLHQVDQKSKHCPDKHTVVKDGD